MSAIEIFSLSDLWSIAAHIVKSNLFGVKTEDQAMALMLLAQAENLHPMTAIQDFDIVNNKPARKTTSILARFQAAGGTVSWEVIDTDRAIGTFSHKQGGSLRVEWTAKQAAEIGLTKNPTWKQYPKAMLRSRCIGEGVRAVYPAAIGGGILTPEEAQDIEPLAERDMGAAEVVQPREKTLPPYPSEQFDANLPQWRALIAGGRESDRIIAMVSTKFVMNDEQKAELRKPIDDVIAEQSKAPVADEVAQ